jgi:tripeptide aminopeptidase
MDSNIERFLRYVKIDTQSNENSDTCPSDKKELNLTRLLKEELEELGIKAEIDQYGRLYAHLDGEKNLETIGLNSHVDTAGEISGANVKPQYIKDYQGQVIDLTHGYSMDPKDFPSLKEHLGDDLIVTSGDTLLGGDDKAGLAIIMATVAYFVSHPEIKHHPLAVLFTPDEEIGRGPEHFDVKKFGATYAYTVDGDYIDNVEIENFNAAHANVTIHGATIHPGEAKGRMINAARLAGEFDSLLSPTERPELTEEYEGFNHLMDLHGSCETATLRYIIRNHDAKKLEAQKQEFFHAKDVLEKKYPRAKIEVEIGDDYRNMKEVFDKDNRAVIHAEEVFAKLGIKIRHSPIRGGTDGATFSFKGCPTPNLGTGSYNHHGRYEYLSVRDFTKMIEIVTALIKA